MNYLCVFMARRMYNPIPAICVSCGKEGVLICSSCGRCEKCGDHIACEPYKSPRQRIKS